MKLKTIYRKNKIDNLLGTSTLTANEKELIDFLDKTFYILKYDEKIVCYSGSYLILDSNHYMFCDVKIIDILLKKFGLKHVIREGLIRDFIEMKFNVKLIRVVQWRFSIL
jgi:hypothetical protein